MKKVVVNILIAIILIVCFIDKIPKLLRVEFLLGFIIFSWMTSLVPEWVSAIILFVGCSLGKLVPPKIYLSGFLSSSVWLVFSGLILGVMIKETKLDEYMANFIVPLFNKSYKKILLGTMIISVILIFLMPSAMGRIMIMVPILIGIVKKMNFSLESKEGEGIILIGILSTYLPAFAVLPANVPNNVLVGSMQNLYNINFTYLKYFKDFFPVLGVGKLVLIYVLFSFIYRKCEINYKEKLKRDKMNLEQKKSVIILVITMILWMTEDLHKVPTGWIGMLSALVVILSGIIKNKPLRKIGFEPVFYVAGVISLGDIAKNTGIAREIAEFFLKNFPLEKMNSYEIAIFWIGITTLIGVIITLPGAPAVLTPLAENISKATPFSIEMLCKIQVIGFSNMIFPYQGPPVVVAMQETGVSKKTLTKITIFIFLISSFIFSNIILYQWNII